MLDRRENGVVILYAAGFIELEAAETPTSLSQDSTKSAISSHFSWPII
jgi:hypothetical protein